MKRILLVLAITVAAVCGMQAASVSVSDARQVADNFFSLKSSRLTSQPTRLAYTAQAERFYVFDRGANGPFVVVAGDDRPPQVLGYGESGDFSADNLPPAVQYWLDEMDREIAYLQSHSDAAARQPVKRATPVAPMVTTRWDQTSPYNDMCPTYGSGDNAERAVTGCVATAMAQIMNYHEWPDVGTGSNTYNCNVNGTTPTTLSADFSQSYYQWDLMLDAYDMNSSAESCQAVAKLMSDAGISVNMDYGASSGSTEYRARDAFISYFKYADKAYVLNRDNYSYAEWDQFLVDELSSGRPILYCGYTITAMESGGHAFVFDGFDADGYYHVNWGWGGSYDGYFLFTALAPGAGNNFWYGQTGIFGVIPNTQADVVEDVLYIRSQLLPVTTSAPLDSGIELQIDNLSAEGNMLDTAGYVERWGRKLYYANIPMSAGVFDKDGTEIQHERFDYQQILGQSWGMGRVDLILDSLASLEDGEYRIKLSYSIDEGENYDQSVLDFSGKELYVKMHVLNDTAYLTDCFLSNSYAIESMQMPAGIMVNRPFEVNVNLTNPTYGWGPPQPGPVGNIYLALVKDGVDVATSGMYEISIPRDSVYICQMQMIAPSQGGSYDLVIKDESGIALSKVDMNAGEIEDSAIPVYVLPVCQMLVEDFESMTANTSTSDKNVQGNFTTWSFTKSGVRAPGEGRCNGINSVMMKKPSMFCTTGPLAHDFFLAQAIFFNPSSSAARYIMEYSVDGGTTWQKAIGLDSLDVVEVPGKSQYNAMWMLDIKADQSAAFRITMNGGSTAATYVDDFCLYYTSTAGDVNADGEINVADVNALIDMILSGNRDASGDVNGDGEINIGDVNAIIAMILA